MQLAKPTPLTIAAGASLTASLLLVGVSLASPSIAIGPFVLANWCLFILTTYIAFWPIFWPIRWPIAVGNVELTKLKMFMVVLIAFTVAGWVALANAERIV